MFETVLFRSLDVQPSLNASERARIVELSSLNFKDFYCNGEPRFCPEKAVLYKGNRLLEKYMDDMLEIQKTHDVESVRIRIFYCALKLGHICLLGQDWGRALSAYQRAYCTNKNLFWKDPANYYGLGLVYLHFKEYKLAAEAFSKLLYSYPNGSHAIEAKARLAVCYHNLDDLPRCLKFYNQSLVDQAETPFLKKLMLRFNIALSNENYNELSKAEHEYKKILDSVDHQIKDQGGQATPDQVKLQAACYRQLGWIEYRKTYTSETEKGKHLEAAEKHLSQSQQIENTDGRSYYYLGRCHGEVDTNAHDAFVNYRQSIDKSEANADTWCSIGALYQKQTQPMDALQAFICAVELDPEHSAAWTDLGELYEKNAQFHDALECYKKAVQFNPSAPEQLKTRVIILEKELALPVPARPTTQTNNKPLPPLKEAWAQPIPSELRQRQDEHSRIIEQKYRDGSIIWRMGDLAAPVGEQEPVQLEALTDIQKHVLQLLELNKEYIVGVEQTVYELLKTKKSMYERHINDDLVCLENIAKLPLLNEADVISLQEKMHLSALTRSNAEMKEEKSDDEKFAKPLSDLPETFSLLAPINVPYDITAQEVLNMSAKRIQKKGDFKPIFAEEVRAPSPPPAPKVEDEVLKDRSKLLRPTPLLLVQSRKEAQSLDFQKYLDQVPIALIRNLTSVLRMDLSLFSTKSLLETAASDEMEVRTQFRMSSDVNVDHLGNPTWECYSTQKFTTITKYAQYQAETFKLSLKEEAEKLRQVGSKYSQTTTEGHGGKRRKIANNEEVAVPMKEIKFGTNVDLSDDVKWKAQLFEISKMPPFCRIIAGNNMLTHLGHQVLGMNTVQLYMKVPGSRTPAHQENNSFASININIGPGDCEWFGCPYEYWGVVEKLCEKHGIDFLKGSYWPNLEELLANNVPVYRFTQKAGDIVWVGGGCVHWVQATGWCNNIAWNVGPLNYNQLSMSIYSHEYNKVKSYKSLVPMQHLAWQLAKNVQFTNQSIYTLIKGILIRSLSFCKIVIDYATSNGKQLKPQSRTKNELAHYCTTCEIEVFNILFVKEVNGKFPVYCVYCSKQQGLDNFIVLQQITMSELTELYDGMVLKQFPNVALTA